MAVRPHSIPTNLQEVVSYNPATGEENGRAPVLSPAEVQHAVNRARFSQPAWAKLSYKQRGHFILSARELVLAQLEEIATLIANETGKPRPEEV